MWHWNVRNQNQGFTLIEVLVVTIILSIVAAIAAPNLLGLLNRNRVNQGLTEFEGAINEAQRQAIRDGRPCTITVNTSNNSITGGCLLSIRNLSDNLSIATNVNNNGTSNQHDINFSGKGNVSLSIDTSSSTNRGTFVVYMSSGTPQQKCLVFESLLGSLRSGDYTGTPAPTPTNANCS